MSCEVDAAISGAIVSASRWLGAAALPAVAVHGVFSSKPAQGWGLKPQPHEAPRLATPCSALVLSQGATMRPCLPVRLSTTNAPAAVPLQYEIINYMDEQQETNFNEATAGLENELQSLCKQFRCLNYTSVPPSERSKGCDGAYPR